MTKREWLRLAELSRRALDEIPEARVVSEIAQALRTTGAFAVAVADGIARAEEQRS